jgi:hypothetical protein
MPADVNGYLSANAALLERVNENDVEQSKILRKPLNVQSGKEDGHQGGRRFNPGDVRATADAGSGRWNLSLT